VATSAICVFFSKETIFGSALPDYAEKLMKMVEKAVSAS